MKNVVVRFISGIIYIAVFVACILCGPYWFMLLTAVLTVLGLNEFMRLVSARISENLNWISYVLPVLGGLGAVMASYYVASGCESCAIIAYAVILTLLLCILGRAVTTNSPNALTVAAHSFLGLGYIALPLALLNMVYSALPGEGGRILILISLICIWINDTGAFCVGSLIGKRRLCERLSPKKSWEGFWGGLVLVVAAMVIYSAIEGKGIAMYALYGALISVLATVGDLFESLLKRTAGVKDSGRLIPGHGGILDRIDSFLFVAYAIVLLTLISSTHPLFTI